MLLDKELLKQVKRIQIKTDRMASEILVGEYQSAFKGKGLNFDSIREYQAGDDIRSIDWNVTARMADPFIRQYKEERRISIFLMIDLSASNDFGTQRKNKKELATELCAVLASLAVKNSDRVGLIAFTDKVELYIPPKQGKAHVFRLIRDLLAYEPNSKKTDFKASFTTALSMIPRNSVVFLISDFIPAKDQEFEDFKHELKVFRQAQDIVALSIRDPREFQLPNIGYVEIINPETGSRELLNLNKKSVREAFNKVQSSFFVQLKEKFKAIGIDFLDIQTHRSYIPQLLHLFMNRERRK